MMTNIPDGHTVELLGSATFNISAKDPRKIRLTLGEVDGETCYMIEIEQHDAPPLWLSSTDAIAVHGLMHILETDGVVLDPGSGPEAGQGFKLNGCRYGESAESSDHSPKKPPKNEPGGGQGGLNFFGVDWDAVAFVD